MAEAAPTTSSGPISLAAEATVAETSDAGDGITRWKALESNPDILNELVIYLLYPLFDLLSYSIMNDTNVLGTLHWCT
jgi:hypothetical protein